jgi:hypothetical protein
MSLKHGSLRKKEYQLTILFLFLQNILVDQTKVPFAHMHLYV